MLASEKDQRKEKMVRSGIRLGHSVTAYQPSSRFLAVTAKQR